MATQERGVRGMHLAWDVDLRMHSFENMYLKLIVMTTTIIANTDSMPVSQCSKCLACSNSLILSVTQ